MTRHLEEGIGGLDAKRHGILIPDLRTHQDFQEGDVHAEWDVVVGGLATRRDDQEIQE